ncbi:hypothetical protein BABINDRAFT_117370 [Babjeviella inositovora NRRL Y-12698]|uniref:PITH domain-containing protein n=1 Tax=Babjeviella inositovora NRRL Y-12698 TaxID=984486 RepID=A0A1E3QH71_9ASCO|nr:uncharacterized protein BABINDRAFT_117370 [Babjeviella inositovora NRRL Y-12698]ODQ76948.1 hypothetical protein BABINDRAFT_117370 [Babjeviella inositovora NRRL Y-12698]
MSCHSHSHSHDDHSHVPPIPTSATQSLKSQMDLANVRALNMANPPTDLPLIFRDYDVRKEVTPCVESDCDEQLIFNIPFTANVKLYSVILRTSGDGSCPHTIKLFKNNAMVDFDNVEGTKATFTTTQPQVGYVAGQIEGQTEGQFVEHFLPRHLFTNVQHLTLFVEDIYDNDEFDTLKVYYVELRGEYTPFTRDPVITMYEAAANPADHKNMLAEESGASQLN